MYLLSTDLYRIRVMGVLLLMALAAVVAGAPAVRAADKADLMTVASVEQRKDPTLILTRGMAEIVTVEGAVADIMVANPSLVDVTALQSNRLYIVGVDFGTTNIIALDDAGNVVKRLNVHVKIDDVAIQNTIEDLFPDEEIRIASTAEQVMLTGHVSTPDVAQKVSNVVSKYVGEMQGRAGGTPDQLLVNLLTVAGEQQVMLRVKVVEASRDVLRELGIETNLTEEDGMANITGSIAARAAAGLTTDPLGIANVIYDTGANGFGPLNMIVRALEEKGLINTLAEPNLTAISGEQAGFLAGGEFPVPTSRDQDGNIVITYRPFGVALNFKPVVLSGDRISLQLQTEVSSVSNQNSYSINELVIPGFAVRRAETTVELGSGGSLMIAGLLQSEVTKGLTNLPGINDIPILGALMQSDSFQRQESELVVIVTAYLVKPYDDAENNATVLPVQEANPLAKMFADNIRKTYAKLNLEPELFADNERYGYLID